MQILEYKLHQTSEGMTCPPWVMNGGYFHNPDNYTFIGVAESPNEFHIPDTVTVLTVAETKTRLLAIHGNHPITKISEDGSVQELTNDEIEASVNAWWEGVNQ
jgi:hypothetical protein